MTTTPRGIRNNNPGNIRNSERNDWAGEEYRKPIKRTTLSRNSRIYRMGYGP